MTNRSLLPLILIIVSILTVSTYALVSTSTPTSITSYAKIEKLGGVVLDFPKIPVYPGAKIENSYKKSERDVIGYQGTWVAQDKVGKIMAWYVEKLPQDGWTVLAYPEFPDAPKESFAQFQKGNLRLNLIVEREDKNETEIHAEFPLSRP